LANRVKTKCIKISYVTKKGKRITYWRKVKVLASGKYRFMKGKCTPGMKKVSPGKKPKRKSKRKSKKRNK
jgi:hypothetical protein